MWDRIVTCLCSSCFQEIACYKIQSVQLCWIPDKGPLGSPAALTTWQTWVWPHPAQHTTLPKPFSAAQPLRRPPLLELRKHSQTLFFGELSSPLHVQSILQLPVVECGHTMEAIGQSWQVKWYSVNRQGFESWFLGSGPFSRLVIRWMFLVVTWRWSWWHTMSILGQFLLGILPLQPFGCCKVSMELYKNHPVSLPCPLSKLLCSRTYLRK